MATLARSAPLPAGSALVEGPQFQELLQRSRSLAHKILLSVPDAHRSCIHTETLQLDSTENAKLEIMAANIGILPAPVLRAVSENFTLNTCLTRMSEGLQLHRALLSAVSERLQSKNKVTELMADIRDLTIQINKMLQKEGAVQPSPTPVALRLHGEYEVQVAAHLTLVQLQSFGRDVTRCLRNLDQSNEEEAES
ncbi:colony stimulating factor 3 (granulocyte) a isoform X2 [Hippoglossus hippoglossus]|nr:colony stimulating factor 3 (granulocyte) a isoform X2 [Hippoglossus hippoglossus]XP_034426690.1 colony stimulating factor 3 (granulocyte) a isoform X2 [Hippoglossus hippoglossus]